MADWSTPQLSSTYTVFRQALNDRLVDAALMFDSASTSATNIPSGAKRWNSTSSKFEKYNGSTWSDLAPLYAISISGNAATATTCSGNAATATNASQLGGYAASYFQVALGFTPVNKAGDTMTGDLTLYRTATPTIGALFLGNSGARYLSYNGTAYTLPGAELIINGGTALRSNNAKTIGGTSLWGAGDIKISTTQIQTVSATVASNALTVTLNPTSLDFRSATLTSGTVNTRTIGSAISLTVPSGATLGTTNAVASRLVILAIDNAGTVELAVVNLKGCPNLDETTLISTTAISAAADNTGVIYSTTARSNVPFRVVGFIDITEAAAGTWATGPTKVQGGGGQSLANMASLGVGQTLTDYSSSGRSLGTTYYNTTGRPILWWISTEVTATLLGSGAVLISYSNPSPTTASGVFLVPPGASYGASNAGGTITKWYELR